MALSGSVLKSALKPEIVSAVEAVFTVTDSTILEKFADALAGAIATKVVDHIKNNAVVSVVTTCSTGSGSGSGTVA